MAEHVTAGELAARFLNGREVAWISAKQAQWLRNLLTQDPQCAGLGSRRDPYSFAGPETHYTLYISPLNHAGSLRNEGVQLARQVASESSQREAERAEIRGNIARLHERASELEATGQDVSVIRETIEFLAASVAERGS